MDRRSFLKMLGVVPAATVLPVLAKPEEEQDPLPPIIVQEPVLVYLRVLTGEKFKWKLHGQEEWDWHQKKMVKKEPWSDNHTYPSTEWYGCMYEDGPIKTAPHMHCRTVPDSAVIIPAYYGDTVEVLDVENDMSHFFVLGKNDEFSYITKDNLDRDRAYYDINAYLSKKAFDIYI